MPQITNKQTGHKQNVTNDQLKVIMGNPMTKNLFDVTHIKEPEELKKPVGKPRAEKDKVVKNDVSDINVGKIEDQPGEQPSEQ
jgi:hypothetical protein